MSLKNLFFFFKVHAKHFWKRRSFDACFVVSTILLSRSDLRNMHCWNQCNKDGTKSQFLCSHINYFFKIEFFMPNRSFVCKNKIVRWITSIQIEENNIYKTHQLKKKNHIGSCSLQRECLHVFGLHSSFDWKCIEMVI